LRDRWLQAELVVPLLLHESFEQGIRTEDETASRRATDLETDVGEVASEEENHWKALREVRALA
jgi:hypothetical protein